MNREKDKKNKKNSKQDCVIDVVMTRDTIEEITCYNNFNDS